jgi:hypothetical protein
MARSPRQFPTLEGLRCRHGCADPHRHHRRCLRRDRRYDPDQLTAEERSNGKFSTTLGFRSSERYHRIVVIDGPNITDLGAESAKSSDAYVINPAGLTEGGVATKHALTETGKPYVEVHFANIVAPPAAPHGLPIGPSFNF